MSRFAGKKILCFVGLPHHVRFLTPVTAALRQEGADVLYITSQDYYPFEKQVLEKGETCRLIQEVASETLIEKINETRKSFCQEWTKKLFHSDVLEQWPLMNQVLNIERMIADYHYLDETLKQEKPDLLLALHERNRWGKTMGSLSRLRKIPYVTFQEGDLYNTPISYTTHAEYSTALLLWGASAADLLKNCRAALEKCVLVGNTHLGFLMSSLQKEGNRSEIRRKKGLKEDETVLVIFPSLDWCQRLDMKAWETALRGLDGFRVVLKWHPAIQVPFFEGQVKPFFQKIFPELLPVQSGEAHEWIAAADACAVFGNTSLVSEILLWKRRLFSFPEYGVCDDPLERQGLSLSLEMLRQKLPDTEEGNEIVDRYLRERFYENNEQAVSRSLEVIETIFQVRGNRSFFAPRYEPSKRCTWVLLPGENTILSSRTRDLLRKVLPEDEVFCLFGESALGSKEGGFVFFGNEKETLAERVNQAVKEARGNCLVLLRGDVFWPGAFVRPSFSGNGMIGASLRTDRGIFSVSFDFNQVPVLSLQSKEEVGVFPCPGFLALPRDLFFRLGGFDSRIPDPWLEIDFCLSARQAGIPVCVTDDFFLQSEADSVFLDLSQTPWQKRISFFAKWHGFLPKNDDFEAHAGDLLTPC